jgi:hypothetical protein
MSDPLSIITGGLFGGNSRQSGVSGFFGIPSVEGQFNPAYGAQYTGSGMATDLMNQIMQQANQQLQQGAFARESYFKRAEDILSGNYDPTKSAMYGPTRNAVEQSYSGARENILSNLPQGGVMQEALADLESTRAQSLSDMMAQIYQGEYNTALQNVMAGPGQYTQLMQTAGNPLQIYGQMIGSILEALVGQMNAGVNAAGNLSPF